MFFSHIFKTHMFRSYNKLGWRLNCFVGMPLLQLTVHKCHTFEQKSPKTVNQMYCLMQILILLQEILIYYTSFTSSNSMWCLFIFGVSPSLWVKYSRLAPLRPEFGSRHALKGKAGSCLPLVSSLQYRTLTNCMYWFPLPYPLPVESNVKSQINKSNSLFWNTK